MLMAHTRPPSCFILPSSFTTSISLEKNIEKMLGKKAWKYEQNESSERSVCMWKLKDYYHQEDLYYIIYIFCLYHRKRP